MTFEERMDALVARHEALTMNLELMSRHIQKLLENSARHGESIRALARMAEIRRD